MSETPTSPRTPVSRSRALGGALLCGALLATLPSPGCGSSGQAAGPALPGADGLNGAQRAALSRMELKLVAASAPSAHRRGDARFTKVDAQNGQGEHITLALDDAGRPLDEVGLARGIAREAEARRSRWGALHPNAHALLAARYGAEERVDLYLFPELSLPDEPDPQLPVAELREAWDAYKGALKLAKVDAKEALRSSLPPGVTILHEEGRFLHVELPAGRVGALVRLPGLAAAELGPGVQPDAGPAGYCDGREANDRVVHETMNLDAMTDTSPFFLDGNQNGTRLEVGVRDKGGLGARAWVETPSNTAYWMKGGDVACVDDSDCDFQCLPDYWAPGADVCGTNHGSTVLCMLANELGGVDRIGTPDIDLYFAGGGDRGGQLYVDDPGAFAWFATNDVHVATRSVGNWTPDYPGTVPQPFVFDDAVRTDNMVVFNAANNFYLPNAAGDSWPTAQCPSPNVVCVGSATEANNAIAGFTSSDNWPGTDREQPDLVTPGTATSWSTPRAAAAAVALHDLSQASVGYSYASLESYPEATKAMLMTAATTNVDGADISRPGAPDERDGAGSIDGQSLLDLFNKAGGAGWSIIAYDTSKPADWAWKTVHLDQGETLRAYMVWSRCPDNDPTASNIDIGLRLYGPGGQLLDGASSVDSYDQTYEVVRATATQTGDHTLNVRRWYFNGCSGQGSEIVALAYRIE